VTGLAVRKGRITEEKAGAFLESLADLPIGIEDPTPTRMFVSVRALAGQHKLTAYNTSGAERPTPIRSGGLETLALARKR
jgi:hypothetical protein